MLGVGDVIKTVFVLDLGKNGSDLVDGKRLIGLLVDDILDESFDLHPKLGEMLRFCELVDLIDERGVFVHMEMLVYENARML